MRRVADVVAAVVGDYYQLEHKGLEVHLVLRSRFMRTFDVGHFEAIVSEKIIS